MAAAKLPQKLPLELMQTQWASIINPILGNPLNDGNFLQGIALAIGDNKINHLLSRKQLGWFLVDIDGDAQIYRSAPLNSQTLTLNSDSVVNVSLYVF